MTVTIYDENDLEIEVTGRYIPGHKGEHDKFGVPTEPEEDPDIEIILSVDIYGDETELTKEQENDALDKLWEVSGDHA